MKISTSYYSEIGGRDKNEDAVSLLEYDERVLALTADGLGGHSDGELASALAVKIVNNELIHQRISVVTLRNAIEKANEEIFRNKDGSGMKTTISAVWFDEWSALAANVGDTRIYQFRDGQVIFQSRDHSVAQMSVLAGDIQPEEVRTSKERHKLTRALGAQDEVSVDIAHLEVQKGDALLLCTDGFWEKIRGAEMAEELIGETSAVTWMENMRARIADRGVENGDNHSAVAIMVG
ncbi:MAG: serine/threonine-protein phosphatase [Lachnoclostridium sp.]|nr:serine/threonine-protein phosphatase [Lachnoclostridium sp.]